MHRCEVSLSWAKLHHSVSQADIPSLKRNWQIHDFFLNFLTVINDKVFHRMMITNLLSLGKGKKLLLHLSTQSKHLQAHSLISWIMDPHHIRFGELK